MARYRLASPPKAVTAGLTTADVIAIARHEADARHWPWMEPIWVRRSLPNLLGRRRWRIVAGNGTQRVLVVVDDASGRVLRVGLLQR